MWSEDSLGVWSEDMLSSQEVAKPHFLRHNKITYSIGNGVMNAHEHLPQVTPT